VWRGLDGEAHYFSLRCPGCQYACRIRQPHLGCKVQCPGCRHSFDADWGEVAKADKGGD
jgi:hypothetical protein